MAEEEEAAEGDRASSPAMDPQMVSMTGRAAAWGREIFTRAMVRTLTDATCSCMATGDRACGLTPDHRPFIHLDPQSYCRRTGPPLLLSLTIRHNAFSPQREAKRLAVAAKRLRHAPSHGPFKEMGLNHENLSSGSHCRFSRVRFSSFLPNLRTFVAVGKIVVHHGIVEAAVVPETLPRRLQKGIYNPVLRRVVICTLKLHVWGFCGSQNWNANRDAEARSPSVDQGRTHTKQHWFCPCRCCTC